MIQFSEEVYETLITKLTSWVGSDVNTFDDHLHGFNLEESPQPFPFVVVAVRTAENQEQSEIGVEYDLWTWLIHIYYVDSREDYAEGKALRTKVMGTISKKLEEDHRLGGFRSTDTDGHYEYVYDSKIDAVLFDYSGQEEYHTFVSELYLTLYTAKN